MPLELKVLSDPTEVAAVVADRFLQRIAAAQGRGEEPHVALTGGTIAEAVHRQIALRAREHEVDWTRVAFWWGDERFVASDSTDRNAVDARRALLDPVGATQVHEVPSTADAEDAAAAAAAYGDLLRSAGAGEFDLVMLGMGPDGHVASLFPGFAQLDVDDRVAVPVTGSPKPPPERVSLTFPALNRTRAVWFLVTGEGKAEAVRRALADTGDVHETPARGINPAPLDPPGETTWFLDLAAASSL
ncbi:6-phosphogluconolactonase [Marmoricola sp. URHA0025 HA25]